jgi:histidine triad (HIT) family protein
VGVEPDVEPDVERASSRTSSRTSSWTSPGARTGCCGAPGLPAGVDLAYSAFMTQQTPAHDDCFFCSIGSGAAGVPFVVERDAVVAIRDINPQAPTHVLVIPREHYRDVPSLAAAAPQTLADLIAVGQEVASAEAGGEFRLVFNTGASVGQSVFHVHGHVLAGRSFGWPPG